MKDIKNFNAVLAADIPKEEYEVFKVEVERKNKRLLESIKNWKPDQKQILINFDLRKIGIKNQSEYKGVPFRIEEYDHKSTVASSGCAVLVAKFLEAFFEPGTYLSVEQLAKLAIDKGYRGYRKNADGTYTPTGCKHVFFDRFIPSL